MREWQVEEAETRFSELIRKAEHDGPQAITRRGQEVAVMLSKADYERLSAGGQSLVDFMRRSPLYGYEEIEFTRDCSATRDAAP
jgi:prevent-host-death family protein